MGGGWKRRLREYEKENSACSSKWMLPTCNCRLLCEIHKQLPHSPNYLFISILGVLIFCFFALVDIAKRTELVLFLAHACCQNTPPEAGLFQANSRSTLCWKGVLQKKARICRGEGNCRDRRHIEDSKKKNRGADDTTSGNPTCIALQGGGGNSSAQILHTDRNLFAMHTRGCGGVQSWHGWKIKCEVRILSSGSGW